MNIMISGPITGVPSYMDNFAQAEVELKQSPQKMVHTLNPAALDMRGLNYEDCMKITLEMTRRCDAIYMLRGFENSKGAMREYELAQKLHKTIIFQQVEKDE